MARILIVDDAKEIRSHVMQILNSAGHETLPAADAMEAMELLNSYRVDLLLLDIEMPYTNGLQFSETLRESLRYKFLPIIFLTARREQKDLTRALKVQIENYLIKPINPQKLLEAINAVIAKNPPREHLKCLVDGSELPIQGGLERRIPIELVSISEVGMVMRSTSSFENEEIVNIDTPFFAMAKIPPLPLKVASQRRTKDETWEIHLSFCNLNQEIITKIRNWLLRHQKNAA